MNLPTNRRNTDNTQLALGSIFRERKPAEVPGYTNALDGGPEGAQGDGDAPWVKTPAFVTDPIVIADQLPIPLATDLGVEYLALPEIQCRLPRLLQVFFAYTMTVGGQLSIIPELFAGGQWYAQTLVDATVTPFVPAGTRFAAGGFGSRQLEGTELRTDVLAAGIARFALAFDVSCGSAFRLNVIDVSANAGNLLQVSYALSD